MSDSGTSLIGVVQQETHVTGENLRATAAGVRAHVPALRMCLAHTLRAMGQSHQSDVPALVAIVEAMIQKLEECASTIESSAQRVFAIEART